MTASGTSLRLHVAETGSGPDFVFQHGLCGDAKQTAELFPDDAGYRLLTLECRGHGRSEPGPFEALSIATFADDVADMIEARADVPVVLGGISMGAAIALRLAARRPKLVRALVVVRPAWVTKAAPENMRAYGEVGELIARYPPTDARERFERSDNARWLASEGPDNLVSLRGFLSREPLRVTAALLTRIAEDGPGVTEAEVAAINVPTLTIGQGRDPLHPIGYAKALAAMIPGARFEEVAPKSDNRAAYVSDSRAALRRFLEQLSK